MFQEQNAVHLDRTRRPMAYCLQKQAWIMNSDKGPKPQLQLNNHTSPNSSSTEAISQSTPPPSVINPPMFAAKWIEGPSGHVQHCPS